jgi:hypothetical protein
MSDLSAGVGRASDLDRQLRAKGFGGLRQYVDKAILPDRPTADHWDALAVAVSHHAGRRTTADEVRREVEAMELEDFAAYVEQQTGQRFAGEAELRKALREAWGGAL